MMKTMQKILKLLKATDQEVRQRHILLFYIFYIFHIFFPGICLYYSRKKFST